MLRIKLVRSPVAHQWRTRAVVESLGLRKIRQVVIKPDNPSIRGMVHRVKELLEVEEIAGDVEATVPVGPRNAHGPRKKQKSKAEESES